MFTANTSTAMNQGVTVDMITKHFTDAQTDRHRQHSTLHAGNGRTKLNT